MTKRPVRRNEKKARNDQIRAWRDAGLTYEELAEKFGVSKQRVQQIVGPDGFRMVAASRRERDVEILALLAEGLPPAVVGRRVGVSRDTVRRVAARAGVEYVVVRWSQAKIMEAVLQWRMDHEGAWPTREDWQGAEYPVPSVGVVETWFASWDAMMEAVREWLDKAA